MTHPTTSRLSDAQVRALDAAAGLLHEHGPANGGLRVNASAVCDVAGISRSTFYRYWPSAVDLTFDLQLHCAVTASSWTVRILEVDPTLPTQVAFDAALRTDRSDIGVFARVSVAAQPIHSAIREQIARAELTWLDAFTGWMERHLAANGRLPSDGLDVRDVAVLVAALAEGLVLYGAIGIDSPKMMSPQRYQQLATSAVANLLDILASDKRDERDDDGDGDGDGDGGDGAGARDRGVSRRGGDGHSASGVVAEGAGQNGGLDGGGVSGPGSSAEPGAPGAGPAAGARAGALDESQAAVVEAILWALEAGDDPAPIVGVRLVDVHRLARSLGITDRRVRMMWPTATEFNRDLGTRLVEQHREVIDDLLAAVLEVGFGDRYDTYAELFSEALQQIVRFGCGPTAGAPFGAVIAVLDPEVAAAYGRATTEWATALRTPLLALLQGIGFTLLPSVNAEQYATAVFAGIVGADRLAMTHPELLDRRVGASPAGRPLLGFGLDRLFRSLTLPSADPIVRQAGPAPVLADEAGARGAVVGRNEEGHEPPDEGSGRP